jgi:anti-sigma B factor antagonist
MPVAAFERVMSDITLLSLPVELFGRALEHQAGLRRELEVIRLGGAGETDVPDRFAALMAELRASFSGYGPAMDILGEAVAGRGRHVDVVIPVPSEDDAAAADAVERLRRLMREVDAYSAAGGRLLTVATPADLVTFRDWFLGEIVGQLRGASPVRWTDFVQHQQPDEIVEAPASSPDATAPLAEGWSMTRSDDQIVLSATGALDLDTAAALRDALRLLEAQGEGTITVDLRDVGFVDSVGLSVLVAAHTRSSDRGARFKLLLPARLERLFEIAGLRDVLDVTIAPDG